MTRKKTKKSADEEIGTFLAVDAREALAIEVLRLSNAIDDIWGAVGSEVFQTDSEIESGLSDAMTALNSLAYALIKVSGR